MQQDTSYLMENLELDYEQAYEIEEEERALLMLHHNLYHLTLEAKLRVFLLLFLIIFIPATIVFLTCYLRDRRLQRLHKIRMKTLLESGPDPSLPYRYAAAFSAQKYKFLFFPMPCILLRSNISYKYS